MLAMTEQQCTEWCSRRSITGRDPRHLTLGVTADDALTVPVPKVGLDVVGLSNVLSLDMDTGHPATLLWLVDWGMWSEDYDAVGTRQWEQLLRTVPGGAGSLSASPGILFDEADALDQRVFMATTMLYQWDFVLVPDHGNYMIRASHHGELKVLARDLQSRGTVVRVLEGWKAHHN